MTIEQPKFESPEGNPENMEGRSNVIEGPWTGEVPKDQLPSPEVPKDNVVIGPWPGSGLEAKAVPELEPADQPSEQPENKPIEIEPAPLESESERLGKLETARQELNKLPDTGGTNFGSKEDKTVAFSESKSYTEYKPQTCEKCGGTGRYLFIFKCPICKGLGKTSVPDLATTKSSRYEVKE